MKNNLNTNHKGMKNKYLLLNIVILVLGVIFLLPTKNNDGVRKYQPRESENAQYSANGAAEYLNRIKANQETGKIDIKDVKAAQKELSTMPQRKSGTNSWAFRGPDNIGGRTRALLIDKDNSSIMYAGGVSGGLWKSTSSGQFWKQIKYEGLNDEVENLSISCITQASNGDIYFGTGEGFAGIYGGGGSGFVGDGIWKSSDNGDTFLKLESTRPTDEDDAFYVVNEVAADPTNSDILYAGTHRGLKVSNDAGNSWSNVEVDQGTNNLAHDVAVNENGLVVASIGNKCYIKKPDANIFELRSGKDDSQGGNLITDINVSRIEFAFAPSDPNYIYSCLASQSSTLRNICQSKDGGDNWVTIGKGGSDFFNPLGTQGYYDMAIGVHADNKDMIYVGGLDMYEGKAVSTGDLFDWTQISYWHLDYWNENFVHADIHAIIFDLKNPGTFFVGSDGGISRGFIDYENTPYLFKLMNNGYGVTQYYSVAANSLGHLVGGTQDNGSLIIDGQGNTTRNAREVRGGDGGHVAISNIVPTASFVTLYYGGLYRNVDANYEDYNDFYVSEINDIHWGEPYFGYQGSNSPENEGAFVTPIAYWETDNDELGTDEVAFIARRDYEVDESVVFSSANIFGAPIPTIIGINEDHPEYGDTIGYKKNDTIFYHDPYGSLLALGMARTVWLTRKAASFVNPTNEDWFRSIKLGIWEGSTSGNNTDGMEKTTQLVFSEDGDNLFIATDHGFVYRLSNLKNARDKSTGCTSTEPDDVVTTVTKIAGFSSRAITGLATDPNNPDNLVVTLGNYGNSRYVYVCTKATTTGTSAGSNNFFDITDNLPTAPAYCALVEQTEGDGRVLVGTELGVFMAVDVFTQASSTLTWEPFNEGLDPVAVFQIDQTLTSDWTEKDGMIYIGTHGQGFFENSDYLYIGVEDIEPVAKVDGSKVQMSVYPNPVSDMANINYVLPNDASVKMYLYNMNGQLLMTIDGGNKIAGSENTIQVQMSALPRGTYLLNVVAGQARSTERIIKN